MLQSIWLRAAAAACSFAAFSLLSPSVHADTVLAKSGQYMLTQSMENDVLAVWQIVADRPLAPADRLVIQNVDISLFRHDPAWLTDNIRQTHEALTRLMHLDAAQRADLRQSNLVYIYCTPQALHMTAAEAAGMQAVMARYVPIVGVDAASGSVITERDIKACAAASTMLAAKSGVPRQDTRIEADLRKLARHPAGLGPRVSADLAGMERNWAAFQMTWPHESASYQSNMLGKIVASVRRSAARGQAETGLTVAALALTVDQYADYPYVLNPKLAAYKHAMDARMSRFQNHMLEYNLMQQQRGMHDFARSMNGQGPDPQDRYNPIPLPTP